MLWDFLFGWLFGRGIRNAGLPDSEKQRRWDRRHGPTPPPGTLNSPEQRRARLAAIADRDRERRQKPPASN